MLVRKINACTSFKVQISDSFTLIKMKLPGIKAGQTTDPNNLVEFDLNGFSDPHIDKTLQPLIGEYSNQIQPSITAGLINISYCIQVKIRINSIKSMTAEAPIDLISCKANMSDQIFNLFKASPN